MIKIKKLSIDELLPLTCSRTGTCCHGKLVQINPWELISLAKEKKITPREFRDLYCELGGIRLRFNGKLGWKEQAACSQYVENLGCSVHLGRPLACRLYPLGRQIQNNKVHYMYQGDKFPCLEGCPEVLELPQLSVGEYLKGQLTDDYEKAQDEYLEVMQSISDIAFQLLLDTGLYASGDKETLRLWKEMGNEAPERLAERIEEEWMDYLMLPDLLDKHDDPVLFAQKHNELLQLKLQEKFGTMQTNQDFHEASVFIMGLALHLARGIGTNPKNLSEHWVKTAKIYGASI